MNNNNYLIHHGILGMKWGVRRYQNKDGSLTSAGRRKYRAKSSDSNVTKKVKNDLSKMTDGEFKKKYKVSNTKYMKRVNKYGDPYMNSPLAKMGKKIEAEAKKNEKRIKDRALVKEYMKYEKGKPNTLSAKQKADYHKSMDMATAKRLEKKNPKLEISSSDSSVTKKAKKDYNSMNDQEFLDTYSTSKKIYAKRVKKHGDPYKKAASKGESFIQKRLDAKVESIQKDIDSFAPYIKKGITTKGGALMLSPKDVQTIVSGLEEQKLKYKN